MEKKEIHNDNVIRHDKNGHNETIVDEESVRLDSFKSYPSSDDDNTKIVDGEKVIEDFHLYKEDTDEDK